ncbi:hypothetical protein MGH68_12485 [Erysipelothrix sp. D19-032]
MKKRIKILLALMIMLLSLPVVTIVKADGISIVGPEVLAPGATATYTVYFSSNEPAYFQYSVTTQNGIGSASGMDPNDGVGTVFSIDVDVTMVLMAPQLFMQT